jgi:hypothetical protein
MPVPCFLLFLCFRKATQKIFSELDETKAKVPMFPDMRRSPKQRRRGTGASHTIGWRGQPLAHATRWWAHLARLLTLPFPPIYSPRRGKPKPDQFSMKHTVSHHRWWCEIGRVQKPSRHPTEEGNHHQRPSSSPCLPWEWCVSSLPWTTGP